MTEDAPGVRARETARTPPIVGAAEFRWSASEVLFDMDGTLLDSVEAIERAWATWSGERGLVLPDPQLLHGRTAADLVRSLVEPAQFADAFERLCLIEEHPEAPLPPVPGAAGLLAALPAGRWSIVTSATRRVALARLRASGLPMPEHLITGDDVAAGKPDPGPFLAGRRHVDDVRPAVAFEDSIAGLVSARAAGCRTIAVLGARPAAELAAHADALVATLEGIAVETTEDGGLLIWGTSLV